MPRPLFDSEFIFGIHEPGGEQWMLDAGRPGWIVFTEELGRDPNNFSGKNFLPWANRNLGILCRLNNGYFPNGTIPNSAFYDDFARRCANYVANSQGCKIWIIGNETNFEIERPPLLTRALAPASAAGSDVGDAPEQPPAGDSIVAPLTGLFRALVRGISGGMGSAELFPESEPPPVPSALPANDDPFFRGSPQRFNAIQQQEAPSAPAAVAPAASPRPAEVITPELYARCYRLCRDAIRRVPGHADDQVLIGAVAPWNNQTQYPGNPNGDWVQYLQDILRLLGPTGCDGITLHTYTHDSDPNLIHDAGKMNPPFQNRHFQFFAYRDFMNVIPADMRHLPVYITETDQDVPWLDQNNGWVKRAYAEVNWWNQQPGNQQIRALVLYRWPNIDRWVIETKPGVIADFRDALQNDYRWRATAPPPPPLPSPFQPGQEIETTDTVNLRQTPGYLNKPASDVIVQAPPAARLMVLSGVARSVDNLTWWNVRYARTGQVTRDGWAAQTAPSGVTLLRPVSAAPLPPPPPTGKFAIGNQVRTSAGVNLRRTPGHLNKPADDVITGLPAATTATVAGGPTPANGLTWWRLRGGSAGSAFDGWVAEVAPNGQVLLEHANPNMIPDPTPPTGKFRVGDTVVTRTIVRMRRTPGITNKPANDVLADINQGVRGTVMAGPRTADSLTWWQVSTTSAANQAVVGWMAESAPGGAILLDKVDGGVAPPPVGSFAVGELVVTADTVRIRRTPGIANKPPDDTLGAFAPRTTLNILEGPRRVDELDWWRVGGITLTVGSVIGWVAEKAPNGVTLVARPAKLPGTNIPDRAAGRYLGAPFSGAFGVSQLWGENPHIYRNISYDGVPLKGHNGIDFLTPNGMTLLAVDDGVVDEAVANDPNGFGHYVKLRHSWGESIYAHMESFSVQPGQTVQRGQSIGRSDNTGFSSGPHLHFAIRINPYDRRDGWGGFTDPLPYMNPRDVQLPAYVLAVRSAQVSATAVVAMAAGFKPLSEAPGYAPDQAGLRRP